MVEKKDIKELDEEGLRPLVYNLVGEIDFIKRQTTEAYNIVREIMEWRVQLTKEVEEFTKLAPGLIMNFRDSVPNLYDIIQGRETLLLENSNLIRDKRIMEDQINKLEKKCKRLQAKSK